MMDGYTQEFENWWALNCPEFDGISTKHVLKAWAHQDQKIYELLSLLKIMEKRFPVRTGLEDDEVLRFEAAIGMLDDE